MNILPLFTGEWRNLHSVQFSVIMVVCMIINQKYAQNYTLFFH